MGETPTHMEVLHHATLNKGSDMELNADLKSRMRKLRTYGSVRGYSQEFPCEGLRDSAMYQRGMKKGNTRTLSISLG